MRLVTLDFETYYDKQYSLSKLTTEEYIQDERFEVIGVALKVEDGPCKFYSGNKAQIAKVLEQYDLNSSAVLAHNAMFDGAILSFVFGIRPAVLLDTLCMGRAIHGVDVGGSLSFLADKYNLGKKGTEVVNALGKRRVDFSQEELASYGSYCRNDVNLTYKLYQILVQKVQKKELRLIDLTLRMFTEPTLDVDTELLRIQLMKVRKQKKDLLESSGCDRETLMSNPKFAELLKAHGVEPPMKVSARTNKETFAFSKTDEDFKALLEHPDIAVQTFVSARLGTKSTIEETRIERFIEVAQRNNGKLPIPLKYYGAHTGRWSGSDKVNLQNLPSRDKEKAVIKKALLAPEGYDIIDCDSSQIEARVLAWLAGQEDLVQAFANKQDVYKMMASKIYNKPEEEITTQERFVGKTVVLGCGYGTGWKKLQQTLKAATPSVSLSDEQCKHIIKVYRESNSKIVDLWAQGDDCLAAFVNRDVSETVFGVREVPILDKDSFILPSGFHIYYPELRSMMEENRVKFVYKSRKGPVYLWGGSVVENVVQALARCIVGEQMLKVSRKYRVVLTVHDAVACITPTDETAEAVKFVEECMSWNPPWAQGLPIACESGFGKSYGDC